MDLTVYYARVEKLYPGTEKEWLDKNLEYFIEEDFDAHDFENFDQKVNQLMNQL